MRPRLEVLLHWGIVLLVLALISVPYLYAASAGGSEKVFGGFLLNPVDGNSYLAKMHQGWEGAWRFTLPYSAQPGAGVPLNLYYLFLGHLARWLGAPLLLIFHLARLLSAAAMLLAVYRYSVALFTDWRSRQLAFCLAALGSGLGWLGLLFGRFAPDFWVAEAYPFLAAYANAHFPLGLALQFWLLTPLRQIGPLSRAQRLSHFAAVALLSLVYPFGLAVLAAVLLANLALRAYKRLPLRAEVERVGWMALGGGPYTLYQLWVVNTHPVLSLWNAQNQTPAPPILDLLIALSPVLLLALLGAYFAWQMGRSDLIALAVWLLVGLVLVYLPFNLQRRMLSGIYLPLAFLAVWTLELLSKRWRRWRWLGLALILLSLPTNLIVLWGGVGAARAADSALFVQRAELAAFDWLDAHAAPNSLVMASPESGLLLPAYSSASVLYGHPLETVRAAQQRRIVEEFFTSPHAEAAALLNDLGVDFVLYGPRERALGRLPDLPGWTPVFEQGSIQLYAPLP